MNRRPLSAAIEAIRHQGYDAVVSWDLDELWRVQEENRETWPLLLPTLDWRVSREPEAVWLKVLDPTGRVVAARGARLFELDEPGPEDLAAGRRPVDWTARPTSLEELAESLRLFYSDPKAVRAPMERVRADPRLARVRGTIAAVAAGWTHPLHRGQGLSQLASRAVRLLAEALWDPDWHLGFAHDQEADRQAKAYRYPIRIDGGVVWSAPRGRPQDTATIITVFLDDRRAQTGMASSAEAGIVTLTPTRPRADGITPSSPS
jgi:hypothetical protein